MASKSREQRAAVAYGCVDIQMLDIIRFPRRLCCRKMVTFTLGSGDTCNLHWYLAIGTKLMGASFLSANWRPDRLEGNHTHCHCYSTAVAEPFHRGRPTAIIRFVATAFFLTSWLLTLLIHFVASSLPSVALHSEV